jgi:hypothetical protein
MVLFFRGYSEIINMTEDLIESELINKLVDLKYVYRADIRDLKSH